MHPVRRSEGWQLNPPPPTGEWKQIQKLDAQTIDPVVEAICKAGARITKETTDAGEKRDSGSSLVWLVEWRADPETAQRVIDALKAMDEEGDSRPVKIVRKKPEDDPGWSPWDEGVSP